MTNRRSNSGQVVVILLMVMVVVLTLGLSIASRATTDIRLATKSEESARAFAAAEAGIEKALVSIATQGYTGESFTLSNFVAGDAGVEVAVEQGVTMGAFAIPGTLVQDDPVQVWLTDYPNMTDAYTGSQVTVYWGATGSTCTASPRTEPGILVVDVFHGVSQLQITNTAIDPCGASGFSSPDGTGPHTVVTNLGSTQYAYKKTVTVHQDQTKLLRIRLLHADGPVAVGAVAPGSIPTQGQIIESTGTVAGTQRRIQLFRSFPQLPAIFDYVLFSTGDITK